MHAGESCHARFKAKNYIIDQVIDWFGKDVDITRDGDDECVVKVYVNKEAFFHWAMQYGLHIEVLEPLDLREKIKDSVKAIGEKYGGQK